MSQRTVVGSFLSFLLPLLLRPFSMFGTRKLRYHTGYLFEQDKKNGNLGKTVDLFFSFDSLTLRIFLDIKIDA